jgi:hypothetical protein
MQIIFDEDDIQAGDEASFSAVFIHQDYYEQLLNDASVHFGLNLLDREREVPIVSTPYMLLDNHVGSSRLMRCLGKKYILRVSELVYHKALCLVVALVVLDKNITCSVKPHIVVAKNPELPSRVINEFLDGKFDHLGIEERRSYKYDEPIKLKHCRIGIMLNSNMEKGDYYKFAKPEEQPKKTTKVTIESGVPVITEFENTDYVRPELQHVVERASDKTMSSLSIESPAPIDRTKPVTKWNGKDVYRSERGKYFYINGSGAKIYPPKLNNGDDGINKLGNFFNKNANVVVRIRTNNKEENKEEREGGS